MLLAAARSRHEQIESSTQKLVSLVLAWALAIDANELTPEVDPGAPSLGYSSCFAPGFRSRTRTSHHGIELHYRTGWMIGTEGMALKLRMMRNPPRRKSFVASSSHWSTCRPSTTRPIPISRGTIAPPGWQPRLFPLNSIDLISSGGCQRIQVSHAPE